ncbi:MAG: GDP-mannose 4,6-dehydratase [Acidimicrobiales bacterium]|nr:GDP-mannose 4,6-dehydratase [Acidimicrobiales bacterium]
MKALVTGGAGFIGSSLVDRLLAEGHHVDAVDDLSAGSLSNLGEARRSRNGRLSFHQLDIRSPDLLGLMERCHPDVVFHLAARYGLPDAVLEADTNLIGSLRVLEAARESQAKKVVFASAASIYGNLEPAELPVKESHPQHPVSPEGLAKKALADYLVAYRDVHNLEFTALALSNVYGPRGGGQGVVGEFAARLLAGEPCTILGDGSHTRDFVYVDDVVDAFARAAERGGGLVLNVGTGVQTSVNELYRVMAAHAGVERPAAVAPARPGEPRRVSLDPGRAAIHLGWKPWTALDEGTAAVIEWLSETGLPGRA